MTAQEHIVFVVDDDVRICEALSDLLSTFDLHAVTFGSAAEYIAYPKPDAPACLILDVELPDMNGLKLQSETAERDLVSSEPETAHPQDQQKRYPDQRGEQRIEQAGDRS